jgi:hypothetical protein
MPASCSSARKPANNCGGCRSGYERNIGRRLDALQSDFSGDVKKLTTHEET